MNHTQVIVNLRARIRELEADRDNSNMLLDGCRHERNVLQKICAERADEIEKLEAELKSARKDALEEAAKILTETPYHSDSGTGNVLFMMADKIRALTERSG